MDNTSATSGKGTRGRPKVSEQWTRVICLGTDNLDNLKVYDLCSDLLLGNAMKATLTRGKQEPVWEALFWPDDYVKAEHSLKINDNLLSKDKI